MRLRGIYWACGVLALSAQAWAQTREIHWVFSPLPLVHRAEQNEPKGFLDRMLDEQLIPQLTGYVHRQDLMPLARRTLNLANDPLACSPGLFKTPERESIAHYSAPLVTMLTGGGFFLSRNDKLKRHTDAQGAISLRSMLADPQLSIGVSLGRSYGREVDALLARSDASIAALVTRNSSQANLAKMLRAERIDVALGHSYEASIMTDAGRLKPAGYAAFPAHIGRGHHCYRACGLSCRRARRRSDSEGQCPALSRRGSSTCTGLLRIIAPAR